MVPNTLLPLRVASQRISRNPEVVLRLVTTGKLVGERIGARWFVSVDSLARFERERAISMHVAPTIVAGTLR